MDDRVDESTVHEWMSGYLRAWESNSPADIRSLFAEDAVYRTDPWGDPLVGVDAIVEEWLERRDEPGSYSFEWSIAGRDGRVVFVEGETRYESGTNYSNLWVIRLEPDGRASAFTEWWMDQADPS